MKTRTLGAVLCLALAAPVLAQAPPAPITWVAYSLGRPGKTEDWVKTVLKYDAPVYDKLLAAGTIRSWGLATPINHRPGMKWNFLTWVTVDDWAGVDKWAGAAMQVMQARTPTEAKAVTAATEATEEPRTHFDEVVRNAHVASLAPGTRFAYFLVGHYLARPGQEEAGTDLYREALVPMGEKLMAEGVVASFGLHVQELHGQLQPGEPAWTHRVWWAVPGLASIDRILAANRAMLTPDLQRRVADAFDMSAHRDDVLMVLHLGGAAAAPSK